MWLLNLIILVLFALAAVMVITTAVLTSLFLNIHSTKVIFCLLNLYSASIRIILHILSNYLYVALFFLTNILSTLHFLGYLLESFLLRLFLVFKITKIILIMEPININWLLSIIVRLLLAIFMTYWISIKTHFDY
jgi:hypothetical protein